MTGHAWLYGSKPQRMLARYIAPAYKKWGEEAEANGWPVNAVSIQLIIL